MKGAIMMTARQALRHPVGTAAHRISHREFVEATPEIVARSAAPPGG
jgi:hypothetical protein